jgi:hypothetical protein
VISMIFSAIPGNVDFVIRQIDLPGIIWIMCSLILIILLFIFLIYYPDKVINWLKLDRGFDDDSIDFKNFNNANILKLAVIVIGGILIIKNIPAFLSHTLFAFKSSMGNGAENNIIKYDLRDYFYWATSFLNILLGYLMLANYQYISRILKEKDDNKTIA